MGVFFWSPLSLRNVEKLRFGRGTDFSIETVRFSRNRFDPMFAADLPPAVGQPKSGVSPVALGSHKAHVNSAVRTTSSEVARPGLADGRQVITDAPRSGPTPSCQ